MARPSREASVPTSRDAARRSACATLPQIVLLDLIPQLVAGDAQYAGGLHLVAARAVEGLLDDAALLFIERQFPVRPGGLRRWQWGARAGDALPHVLRKIGHVDGLAGRQHARVPDHILQLAHVAGPEVARQQDLRARSK